jgi:hypothetical protein
MVKVARIRIKTVIQYHPDASFEKYAQMVTVPPGIRTSDVVSNIAAMRPDIWSASYSDAFSLCQRIENCGSVNADHLLHAALGVRHE